MLNRNLYPKRFRRPVHRARMEARRREYHEPKRRGPRMVNDSRSDPMTVVRTTDWRLAEYLEQRKEYFKKLKTRAWRNGARKFKELLESQRA